MTTKQVFVSYSQKDKAQVEGLVNELMAMGLNIWVDYKDLKRGQNWRITTRAALIASDAVLVCLSPNYLGSIFAKQESFLAYAYQKKIIPVMLNDCFSLLAEHDETKRLEHLQYVLAYEPDTSAVKQIVEAIEPAPRAKPLNQERAYISYSRADKDFARRLADDLIRMGADVWVDFLNIHAGDDWRQALCDGVLSSETLILCLSKAALESEWVRRDVLLALSKNIPIIPIVTENAFEQKADLYTALKEIDDMKSLLDIHWIEPKPNYKQVLKDLQEAFELNAPQEPRKQGLFISYRRADTIDACGRIYDRLATSFGSKEVFKDVMDIPLGVNFATYIDQTLSRCAITLVLMGKQWANIADSEGKQRLQDPEDLVRIEVETALQRADMLVIPLLVGGAAMPKPDELPESLRGLTMLNAVEIRHDPDFHKDMDTLIQAIIASQKAI